LVGAALSVGCHDSAQTGEHNGELQAPAEELDLWLDGPVDRIKGIDGPRDEAGQLPHLGGIQSPHVITIHFPSGRTFTHWSEYVKLRQEEGTVTLVTIAPHPDFVSFHEAIATAEQVARKVRLENPWGLFDRLEEWRGMKQATQFGRAAIVEERVTVFVSVKKVGIGPNGQCYTVLDFSYWKNEASWNDYKK